MAAFAKELEARVMAASKKAPLQAGLRVRCAGVGEINVSKNSFDFAWMASASTGSIQVWNETDRAGRSLRQELVGCPVHRHDSSS
jgi:hypothetical protein